MSLGLAEWVLGKKGLLSNGENNAYRNVSGDILQSGSHEPESGCEFENLSLFGEDISMDMSIDFDELLSFTISGNQLVPPES